MVPCLVTALATILGCFGVQEVTLAAPPAQEVTVADLPRPMAPFARLVGGRWKMTTTAGKDTYDTWSWGPGELSIRSMRVGTLSDGEPWRTMSVYYWHPTLKEVRLLSVGSVLRGVGEGKVMFGGDSAESVFTLNQTGGPRNLRERWTFAGPDKYHDELSEKIRDRYELLAGWDRRRVSTAEPAERVAVPFVAPGSTPSERIRPLDRALGQAWASIAGAAGSMSGEEPPTRAMFEYVPHADAILGRVDVVDAGASPRHAMDIYLYRHTGTGALRVLALSGRGLDDATIYEGDIVPEGDNGACTIRLTQHRASGQQAMEARVELDERGTARVQVSTVQGEERTLVSDRRHQRTRD